MVLKRVPLFARSWIRGAGRNSWAKSLSFARWQRLTGSLLRDGRQVAREAGPLPQGVVGFPQINCLVTTLCLDLASLMHGHTRLGAANGICSPSPWTRAYCSRHP